MECQASDFKIKLISNMINWIPNYIAHTPLYLQLVKLIDKKIGSNELVGGDPLPPVKKVSEACKVPEYVIEDAYRELICQGLILKKFPGDEHIVNHVDR